MYNKSLALSGGGGKGAYQIGVFKSMCENHILNDFDCISGTSVGALNAVLYSIGDYELAEKVWLKFVSSDTMIKRFDVEKAELSRDSLKQMIRYIGVKKIYNRKKVYIYAHSKRLNRPVPFLLNDKSEEEILQLLLASSSMPIVYSPILISGEEYIDGGITPLGNNPIKILTELGYGSITLVSLDYMFNPYSLGDSINGKTNIYNSFPNVKFDIIKPSIDIGKTINGTLDFSEESIRKRIAIGFEDANKKYKKGSNVKMGFNINDEIRELAKEIIKNANDFELFVSLSKFKMPNAKTETLGGDIWYENIFEIDGWKIQCHSGLIQNHYRILDANNRRRAWTLDPKELKANLIIFKDNK